MRARLLCLLVLLLSACGPAASPTPTAGEMTIAITLHDGTVTPNGERREVPLGTRVTFEIHSDRADTVHVHGYDTEIPVQPGSTTRRTLRADRPGRYEVESHDPAMTIVFLNVRS